jgi:hypothetical protein
MLIHLVLRPTPLPDASPRAVPLGTGRLRDRAKSVRASVRIAKHTTGLITGGGTAGAVAWAIPGHPGAGLLITAAALVIAALVILIMVIALIGPDKDRSRFERIMSFTGLVLRRAPATYDMPPRATPAPEAAEVPDEPHGRSQRDLDGSAGRTGTDLIPHEMRPGLEASVPRARPGEPAGIASRTSDLPRTLAEPAR